MKCRKRLQSFIFLAGLTFLLAPTSGYTAGPAFLWYQVKPKDDLGSILDRLGICPLWKKHRKSIQATIDLNPNVIEDSGNFVSEKTKITLPVTELSPNSDYEVLSSLEVIIHPDASSKCSAHRLARSAPQRSVAEVTESPENGRQVQPIAAIPPVATAPVATTPVAAAPITNPVPHPVRELSVSPVFSYTDIHALDQFGGSAELPSALNYGFKLEYAQIWSDYFEPSVFVSTQNMSFSSLDGRSVQGGNSHWYSSFGFGSTFYTSSEHGFFIRLEVLDQQTPIARAVTTQTLAVDQVSLPEAGGKIGFDLLTHDLFGLRLEGGGDAIFPANEGLYSTKLGYSAMGSLHLTDSLRPGTFLELGPYYQVRSIGDSFGNETIKDLGLEIQFKWSFEK